MPRKRTPEPAIHTQVHPVAPARFVPNSKIKPLTARLGRPFARRARTPGPSRWPPGPQVRNRSRKNVLGFKNYEEVCLGHSMAGWGGPTRADPGRRNRCGEDRLVAPFERRPVLAIKAGRAKPGTCFLVPTAPQSARRCDSARKRTRQTLHGMSPDQSQTAPLRPPGPPPRPPFNLTRGAPRRRNVFPLVGPLSARNNRHGPRSGGHRGGISVVETGR